MNSGYKWMRKVSMDELLDHLDETPTLRGPRRHHRYLVLDPAIAEIVPYHYYGLDDLPEGIFNVGQNIIMTIDNIVEQPTSTVELRELGEYEVFLHNMISLNLQIGFSHNKNH